MTPERRFQINNLAEEIQRNFNITTPLSFDDLKGFVFSLNGEIEASSNFDSITSGSITVKDNSSFIIKYKDSDKKERQLFTIAHELGHLFIHMKKSNGEFIEEYIDSPLERMGYSEEEYEANEFAGAFLMPREEFKKFVTEHKTKDGINIRLVAEHFGVSEQSAITRGKWIGIFSW